MAEHEAFLERIRQRPDDDGPRLIYADFLDEIGDPRGAFIRVQCALARLGPDDPRRFDLLERERHLLKAHLAEWTAPLQGLASAPEFRRGFVEVVNVEARLFLRRAADLFAAAPVRHVRLLDVGSTLPRLAACPYLARVRGLTLFAQHLGDRLAHTLADCEHLAGLEVLELGRNRLGDPGVEAIAYSPHLGSLTHLDLSDNLVGDLGAQALAASPRLKHLKRLELHRNEVTLDGLETLAASARLPALTALGLSLNRLDTPRPSPSRPSPRGGSDAAPPRLRHLDLRSNLLPPGSVAPLLESPELGGLHRLDLGHNPVSNAGARALADSPGAASLRWLSLRDTQLGDEGVRALARGQYLNYLTTLDLGQNPLVTDAGARVLLDPNHFRLLRRLDPPAPGVSARFRRMLRARYGLPLRGEGL